MLFRSTVNYLGKSFEIAIDVQTKDANGEDIVLVRIAATFANSAPVYTTNDVDDLKDQLTVTAYYSDMNSKALLDGNYTLSVEGGKLTPGTVVVTVNYGGKTDTFTVDVQPVVLERITAKYTPSGKVYNTTDLKTIKDIEVTGT